MPYGMHRVFPPYYYDISFFRISAAHTNAIICKIPDHNKKQYGIQIVCKIHKLRILTIQVL